MNIPDLMAEFEASMDDQAKLHALIDQHLTEVIAERLRPDLDKVDEMILYGSIDFINKYGLAEAKRINEYISDRPLDTRIPVKTSAFLPPGCALFKNGEQWTLIKIKEDQ